MTALDIGSFRLDALPPAKVDALYVHIPFCFHKCHYCDFYSITRQTVERKEKFVDLLLREADLWVDGPLVQPRTVFFGGGTPTLLPLSAMRRLIRGLRERFDFADCDEWTVEANPATIDLDYCRMLREEGVNRMSLGAQSFAPSELAILERHHEPDDVPRGIQMAREAGFARLNVDLIYAIPGQTMATWRESLEAAIALNTGHVSCYGLTYEPNTPLAVRKRLGKIDATGEELEIEMMRYARQRLAEAGLDAYEISNYARPGEECRHNLHYWTGGSYAALGPAAASHVHGWRWRNRPHLAQWENAVESVQIPAIEVETLSARRRTGELAMLSLRLSRGLNLADCSACAGIDARAIFSDVIGRLEKAGVLSNVGDRVVLSERGLTVADAVAAEFLAAAGE